MDTTRRQSSLLMLSPAAATSAEPAAVVTQNRKPTTLVEYAKLNKMHWQPMTHAGHFVEYTWDPNLWDAKRCKGEFRQIGLSVHYPAGVRSFNGDPTVDEGGIAKLRQLFVSEDIHLDMRRPIRDGTYIHYCTHGEECAAAHHDKILEENRLEGKIRRHIIRAMPDSMKMQSIDGYGNPEFEQLRDERGRLVVNEGVPVPNMDKPVFGPKKEHQIHFRHFGDGVYEFAVTGLSGGNFDAIQSSVSQEFRTAKLVKFSQFVAPIETCGETRHVIAEGRPRFDMDTWKETSWRSL